jgi:hypothetical protein
MGASNLDRRNKTEINYTGECSYSQLKRILSKLLTIMLQNRLNCSSLISMKCDLLNHHAFSELIKGSTLMKARKQPFDGLPILCKVIFILQLRK